MEQSRGFAFGKRSVREFGSELTGEVGQAVGEPFENCVVLFHWEKVFVHFGEQAGVIRDSGFEFWCVSRDRSRIGG